MIRLPLLDMVPEQTLRTAMRVPGGQRLWELLDLIADEDTLNVIDSIAMGYLGKILEQWEVQSNIRVGEAFQLITILNIPAKREALSADLIKAGMRLRNFPSPEHTWTDLKIFIRYLDVHSALYGLVYPDRAGWDKQNMLLANIADSLTWLQWAKTKDGSKGRNRPKPIPRPGVKQNQPKGAQVRPAPLSQVKARFAKRYADNHNAAQQKKLTAGLGRRLPVEAANKPKPTLDEIFGRR